MGGNQFFFVREDEKSQSCVGSSSGFCEFINSVPSAEKWAIDQNLDFLKIHANENVRQIGGDCLKTELPQEYYDAVFVSNFLEHLQNPEEVFGFFEKAYSWLKKDGILAVMGPNFKFCMKDYFDCSDHRVILTDVSLCELGYSAGFTIDECISKFLPYSFRSRLPVSRFFVKNYLKMNFIWPFFGKQFLVLFKK